LGVLLALAVSEWQQEREYEERASTELYNVHLELQSNQEVPTKIHDNNRQTIEKAQAADTAESEDLQFIPGVQVRSTAWQTLLAIGISGHIEYDLLLSLSETYSKQAVYRQTGMPLVDASMSMAAMASVDRTEIDDEIMQEQFMGCFNMIRAMEERLLESYQVSLALF
jgi:hypothetical protein